jgi:chromosome segregation ATPase
MPPVRFPRLPPSGRPSGGGSFTTISEAMTEWKTHKAAKETPLREPAPLALAERLTEFGAELWALALDLANRRLAAERESLDAARVQLEAEKQEAAELADQVTGELETLQTKLAALEAAELAARTEAGGLREQLAKTGERAATAEARCRRNRKARRRPQRRTAAGQFAECRTGQSAGRSGEGQHPQPATRLTITILTVS